MKIGVRYTCSHEVTLSTGVNLSRMFTQQQKVKREVLIRLTKTFFATYVICNETTTVPAV